MADPGDGDARARLGIRRIGPLSRSSAPRTASSWSSSATRTPPHRAWHRRTCRPAEVASAWEQLLESLRALTAGGVVHADLSAYNLLWWRDRLTIIDLPQAVEFTTNADAPELLHRDLANVVGWFERNGLAVDVERVFGELIGLAW